MIVYLVRHTVYSNPENIFPFHLPVALSEEGIAHAQRIAQWFKSRSLFSLPIHTSPIKRTIQTAKIISKAVHSNVSQDARLIETFCPNLQGKKQPENNGDEAWKIQCEDPSRESSESVQKRMYECFDEKVKEGNDCIFVSHGDPLTSLYYQLINKPLVRCLFDDDHVDIYVKKGEIVQVNVSNDIRIERFIV